jgi:hypothetical protein
MFDSQVLLFTFVIAGLGVWWSRRSLRRLAAKIPGPDGLPLIGLGHKYFLTQGKGRIFVTFSINLRLTFPDLYRMITEILKTFESQRLVKNWLGPMLWVFCINPEDTKIIMNSPDCLDKPRIIYGAIFEFGLISINGEEYKAHRKAITPLFKLYSLRAFLPKINQVLDEFLVEFDRKLKREF